MFGDIQKCFEIIRANMRLLNMSNTVVIAGLDAEEYVKNDNEKIHAQETTTIICSV